MDLKKYYDWENMPVASIITIMMKWLNVRKVDFTTTSRANVESGVWLEIIVRDDAFQPLWSVSAQRLDLLKERLIEALDRRNMRNEYLKEKSTPSNQ